MNAPPNTLLFPVCGRTHSSSLSRGLNPTFSDLQVENTFPRGRIVVQLVRAVCHALLLWMECLSRMENRNHPTFHLSCQARS